MIVLKVWPCSSSIFIDGRRLAVTLAMEGHLRPSITCPLSVLLQLPSAPSIFSPCPTQCNWIASKTSGKACPDHDRQE